MARKKSIYCTGRVESVLCAKEKISGLGVLSEFQPILHQRLLLSMTLNLEKEIIIHLWNIKDGYRMNPEHKLRKSLSVNGFSVHGLTSVFILL